MQAFDREELENEYKSHNNKLCITLQEIQGLIINSGETLEGNSFYTHNTLHFYNDLYTKQVNLFWCGKQAKTRICEIGFNAGHSTLLMLLGRDRTPLDFTIFDIGHHRYLKPCLDYIKKTFEHVLFEYIEGDSIITMPKWIEKNKKYIGTYDVVHVDGGHSEECIKNDMKNADMLVKVGGLVIVDDTNNEVINSYVNQYISSGNYIEVNILLTEGYPHRVLQKIK